MNESRNDGRLQFTIFLIGACVLLVACGSAQPKPLGEETVTQTFLPDGFNLQGHRGARGLKPESTLPAFETALDLGVTTLELDLHLTADNVLVVWHDPEIDGTKCEVETETAVSPPDPNSLIHQGEALMVSNLTFEQIRAYRCRRNPSPERFPAQDDAPTTLAGDDYHIVSLAQLFDLVEEYGRSETKTAVQRQNAQRVQFNVETKRVPGMPQIINDGFDGVNPGPFEQAILALVTERGLIDRVTVQSFDHRSLWAIRSVNDQIRLVTLTYEKWMGPTKPAEFAAKGANIWSPNFNDLTPELLAEAHDAGLLVVPWTVNDPADMRRLVEMGVDGLISDRPDLALALSGE